MKVLVDTNVVLDVFMKRQPFYEDAFETLQSVEKRLVNGCLSSDGYFLPAPQAVSWLRWCLSDFARNAANDYE